MREEASPEGEALKSLKAATGSPDQRSGAVKEGITNMAEIVERIVSRYYKALDEGTVLGRKCPECRNVEWPPVYACNACGCMDTEWVKMSGRGFIKICLVPTVMSSKPAYRDLEPYGYCAVQCEEGPERNVMVLNVNKANAPYIREHLPYPVHMEIVERDGYKTAIFAIDPILADGTPDQKLIEKRARETGYQKQEELAAQPAQTEAETGTITGVNPELFAKLAQIVADAYKVDVSEITMDTPFEGKFRASSVVFVGIVAMIENEFDVFMTITDASTHKTVGELAAAVEAQMEEG